MDHESIVVALRILLVPNVQEAVRMRLVLRYPPEQIQWSHVTVIARSTDEQMHLSVQVARNVYKQQWRTAKLLDPILERGNEIVLTRLKDG